MPFEWRVFELAKEPEHPDQNQDAWWLDAEAGVAAIADGVTSGIFSRQWAQILTRAAVADWPEPRDDERFSRWLAGLRTKWEAEIDTSGLAWYQRAKLREGGFSTLVWLRLLNNDGLRDGREQSPVEVTAVGDSCLFHVRGNDLLKSFPLEKSSQFEDSPLVLGSVDLKRDDQLQFERIEIRCLAGDLLVLCTDAVAAWAAARREKGEPVRWSLYWDMSPQDWADEVCSLRSQSEMRYDDATLLLLRVGRTAGPSPEEYTTPTIVLPEASPPDEEVDLLAVDWDGSPVESEAPPSGSAPEEPLVSEEGSADMISDEEVFGSTDVYGLQMPEPAPQPEPEVPPPPPPLGTPDAPPPPPTRATPPPTDDWRDQVNAVSERFFKKVSEGLARGADKLQEAKDSAMKKLREKTEGKSTNDDADK